MSFFIGIDGGGSGSRCVISDAKGKILYRCKGGPTNFLRYSINEVCKTIYALLIKCKKNINISFKEIDTVVIGTAGAGRQKDSVFLERKLKRYLKSKKASVKLIKVFSDGVIALEGAFPNEPGCILISGTGSIIFGKNKNGKYFRLGGYGRKIGDEGSGYSIGRQGFKAVAMEFDGRGRKTLLTNYTRKNLKIKSGMELIDKVYKTKIDIASFAPFVLKAAKKRDKVSTEILSYEADELVKHIKAMKKLINARNFKVAFSGSLISNENYFSVLLRKKIKVSLPGVKIIKPDASPEAGAISIARRYFKN